jgi:drug/metabolite transporter (DMT)-like permease
MTYQLWNILGVILLFVGVLLLFFFGMPYRTRRGGASYIIMRETDKADLKQEKLFDVFGWVGLTFMLAGTAAQVYSSYLDYLGHH